MKKYSNNMLLGILLGLFSPMIGFIGYYLVKYNYMSFEKYIDHLTVGNILSHVVSLCVIINLLIFYLFLNKNKYKTARGVIISTFLYAFWVMYMKVF